MSPYYASVMQLKVLIPDVAAQRYACHGCTNCCRELVVHLTAVDRARIDAQNWTGRLDHPPYVRLDGAWVLNHRPEGGCVFLMEDGRCRIHAEHGREAKPLACQVFPFSLGERSGEIHATLRFDCPSVAANRGDPLKEHRADLNRLANRLSDDAPETLRAPTGDIELVPGRPASAVEVDAIDRHVDRWLRDRNQSAAIRWTGLAVLCDLLANAKLDRLKDDRFVELLGLLMPDLATQAAERLEQPAAMPDTRSRRMLAQAIFAHAEHLTMATIQRGFWQRLKHRFAQLGRARSLGADRGPIPSIAGRFGGRLEELESIQRDPELTVEEIDELITRYVRMRWASGTVYGPGNYGLPLLQGMQSLLLALAVVGWLTRYVALTDGRTNYTLSDVQEAVRIVDRTAGRAPELGSVTARLRLRVLADGDRLLNVLRADPVVFA